MFPSFRQLPLIVALALLACALMVVPLLHAIWLKDWLTARVFFYHGAFLGILSMMIGIATAHRGLRTGYLSQLFALIGAYVLLPAIFALPVEHLVPAITFGQAYFEMLSSFTTTGATVFTDPSTVSEPIHLWRATVAWMGGYLILLAAVAILEPMKLGGFEIEAAIRPGGSDSMYRSLGRTEGARDRLIHHARLIAPPYLILTIALTLGLMLAGDRAFVALCHAMSVLSTSGISPVGDLSQGASGIAGEVLVFLFLFLAISHRSTMILFRGDIARKTWFDPEYKIAFTCVFGIGALLFLRHFIAAFEIDEQENLAGALRALWGSVFNTMSFLTTTGFDSAEWDTARDWSGLNTPGIILLTLCLMGGGIATTTGGIKLLRIYALYKHGVREMQRLIHPNSVGGAGITARRIRREGANLAWIFLMLFMLGVGVLMLALSLGGISFENSFALSVAALTNTGPAAMLLDPTLEYAHLESYVMVVFGAAMIVGRLEVLVFITLFNPNFWRQ